LIRINYFSDFGDNNELLEIKKVFSTGKEAYKKGLKKIENKLKRLGKIKEKELEIKSTLKEKRIPIYEQIMFQKEMLGYSDIKFPELKEYYGVIVDVDLKYSPRLTIYNLKNGEEEIYKMEKRVFSRTGLVTGSTIKNIVFEERNKKKKNEHGDWISLDTYEKWILGCNIIQSKRTEHEAD